MPLYEMMTRVRSGISSRPAPPPEEPVDPGDPGEPAAIGEWLSPGRVVRLPVGYLLVAAALVVVLVIGAYVTGYRRADRRARADYETALRDRMSSLGGGMVGQDPLMNPVVDPPPVSPPVELVAQPDTAAASGPGRARPAGGGWGPVASDPRQAGRFYFVVAETRPAGATRLAEFCRAEGLEAYVVKGHNDRLRRVIILPGFASRSRSDPAVGAMQESILRVGRRWQARERSGSNLSDAYMAQHAG
jgi:hypothetical protein